MGDYILKCLECGKELEDHFTNACGKHNALLKSVYRIKRIATQDKPGLWRFSDWLPVRKHFDCDTSPITYKSKGLAKELGLKNLHIGFNGYWPERKAKMVTCTFKELEASPTLQRAAEHGVKKLVLASAGNTGKAFAYASRFTRKIKLVIVMPECSFPIYLPEKVSDSVCLVSMKGDSDYSDAINLANFLSNVPGFTNEAGAMNVARRDGMGTVILDATLEIGRLPAHYFQAVGSGTGAIAAYESSERLLADGRFGKNIPRFHLSQNLPFTPMANAWEKKRREIVPDEDMPNAKNNVKELYAFVLSNRAPPYAVKGGVFDALTATSGRMYKISKEEAIRAGKIFEKTEEIDIVPAAAVATASLFKAVESGFVGENDCILLNVTGGGEKRLAEDFTLHKIMPSIALADKEEPEEVVKNLGL